ncbi:NOL7 protein, partial [Atractosteus spatula]|nr:NOL7 protein [Atractosteus spatula]
MAKKKHGALGASSAKVKTRKVSEKEMLNLGAESSGDEDEEAPEEVTFEAAKAVAEQRVRDAIESVRRDKETLKQKRRERQELFKEQKKRKLLPEDVLEEIESSVPGKPKTSEVQEQDESGEEGEEDIGPEDGESGQFEEEETEVEQNEQCRMKQNYKVQRVKDHSLAKAQQTSACDFITSRLYGSGSNRTTTNQLLSLQNKTAKNKRAAVQFIDKQWDSKEKGKAELFKKRWIHKQRAEAN